MMNLSNLKRMLFLGTVVGLLASCQTKTALKFNYKIDGNLKTSLKNPGTSIAQTNSNYTKTGNKTLSLSSINKSKPFSSFVKRDSMVTTKTVNGKSSENYTITNTKFERDTFFLLAEKEKETDYVVSGKLNAKILSIGADSLQFFLDGTFSDTIQILNATSDNTEKLAQYIISQDLLKYLQNETKKMANKIASR